MNNDHVITKQIDGTSAPDSSAADFEQYQQARRDGYGITKALLELKLETEIRDVSGLEKAVQEQLQNEPVMIAPWHCSPLAQSACRDGMRLAALEFYWDQMRLVIDAKRDESTDDGNYSALPST
jgi:hypothetical protein